MTSVTSNDSEMGARWSTMPLAKQGSVAKATSYVLQKVTSLRSSRPQRDDDWELAGCYQAGPVPLEVYPTVDMSSSPHSFLAPGQKFHLLELVRGPVISVAHVLPLAKNSRPGWILLEQPEGHGPPPVPKRRIAASSWSINGRYAVKYPATMRQATTHVRLGGQRWTTLGSSAGGARGSEGRGLAAAPHAERRGGRSQGGGATGGGREGGRRLGGALTGVARQREGASVAIRIADGHRPEAGPKTGGRP